MKILFIMCILLSSTSTFALQIQEFDQEQEVRCHAEIKKMGCVKDNDEADVNCIEKKKAALSAPCKTIHASKSKNK